MKPRTILKMKAPLARLAELAGQVRREVEFSLKTSAAAVVAEDGFNITPFHGRPPGAPRPHHFELPVIKKRPRVVRPKPMALPGEVPLWQFLGTEMKRCGTSKNTIYSRLVAGNYPGVKIRRPSRRFVFLTLPQEFSAAINLPLPGEIPLKEFIASESNRTGEDHHKIYDWLKRGKYPQVSVRRVNKRVVFVRVAAAKKRETRVTAPMNTDGQNPFTRIARAPAAHATTNFRRR